MEEREKSERGDALAWAWVLQHAALADRISTKIRGHHSYEEFRQELLLDLRNVYDRYDENRSAISTWIWWRARSVRLRLDRSDANWRLRRYPREPGDPGARGPVLISKDDPSEIRFDDGDRGPIRLVLPSDHNGAPERIEQSVLIKHCLEACDSKELEAAKTVLDGLSSVEVKATIGVSRAARNQRLRRLGRDLVRAGG